MSESIHILSEGGTVFELSLPLHEVVEGKLAKGQIRRVNADGTPYTEATGDVPAPPTSRPGVNENKAAWVAWAVVQGMAPDDAEALTKQDLIERFTAETPPADPATGEAPANPETPAE